MKGIAKKLTLFMLAGIMILTAGCGNTADKGAETNPLEQVNQIPADGIVTKEQFATVAGSSEKVEFYGKTDSGTEYVWTFDSAMIKNPEDQNLKLVFHRNVLDDIKEQYAEAVNGLMFTSEIKNLIAVPTLKITIPEVWEANTAIFVLEKDGVYTECGTVVVEVNETEGTTALTTSLVSVEGNCCIVGMLDSDVADTQQSSTEEDASTEYTTDDTREAADEKTEETTEKNGTVTTEKKSETTTVKKSETTTAKKEETTTAKKSETTTAKKEETTTAKKEETTTESTTISCTISINCSTILDNMDNLTAGKESLVPSNGWILKSTTVTVAEGSSVFDVLKKVCSSKGIHLEYSFAPIYNAYYIEGINNLYEFDCGDESGWMYKVNGWFPNYGCSEYEVKNGDVIAWVYTCNGLGADVGAPEY